MHKLTYKMQFVDWTRAAQSSFSFERCREAGRDPGSPGDSGDDCCVVLRGGLQLRPGVPDGFDGTLPNVAAAADKAASHGQVVAALRPGVRFPGVPQILGLGVPIQLRTQTHPRHASQ